MNRPLARLGLRFVAAAAILGAVAAFTNVHAALRALANARWPLVVVAFFVVQMQIVMSAARWRLTASCVGQTLSIRRAVGEYFGATLLNATLPGGVAGDVVRTLRNRRDDNAGDWQAPARAVVLERAAGQGVSLLLAVAALALWPWIGPAPLPDAANGVVRGALVLVAGLVAAGVAGAHVLPSRLAGFVRGFAPDAYRAFVAHGVWRLQLPLSGVIVGSYLAVFALCSAATGSPLSPGAVVTIVPIVLATMLIPISVGGWGVREAAAAALWPLVGATPASGVAAAVLYGLVCLAGALPGIYILLGPLHGRRGQ